MLTLDDLLSYQKLHTYMDQFLRSRCKEYNHAKETDTKYPLDPNPKDIFVGFEIDDTNIKIYFSDDPTDWEPTMEYYEIPLDLLFDEDFYKKMTIIFNIEHMKDVERNERYELEQYEKLKAKYENK